MSVPFLDLSYRNSVYPEILTQIRSIIQDNWFINGSRLENFEKDYARFNEVAFALGVSNGLDALKICIKALDLEPADEIIVPANSFIASALAGSLCGHKVVLVDPDYNTFNINPKNIIRALTKQTKVIIPVHLYGQSCQMDEIMDISQTYNLHVIEDNAQSQGATYQSKQCGSFGIINATSFYPGKNIGALGDAGAITTSNSKLRDKCIKLRNYGSSQKYIHDIIGYNNRMDEIQAAALSCILPNVHSWNKKRQSIAKEYHLRLKDIEQITLPTIHHNATHVYHLFVIKAKQRDALQAHLYSKGVKTLIHYPIPIHKQNCYRYDQSVLPISEKLSKEILSLPLYPDIPLDHIEIVCESIKSFYQVS